MWEALRLLLLVAYWLLVEICDASYDLYDS